MDALLDETVRILRSRGVNAAAADTGGGILCIAIAPADASPDEPLFLFGTAGERWAAELPQSGGGLWTDVAAEDENPNHLVRGILEAIARYEEQPSE